MSPHLLIATPLLPIVNTGLISLVFIRFFGCLPMPAWAVLAELVLYANINALLSVVYLSITLISIDSSKKSMPSECIL